MPSIPAAGQPWKTAAFSALACWRAACRGRRSRRPRLRGRRSRAPRARDAERDAELDERLHPAERGRRRPRPGASMGSTRPRLVAEIPPVRAGEVDQAAGGEAGGQALPRLLVDQLPAARRDRRVRRGGGGSSRPAGRRCRASASVGAVRAGSSIRRSPRRLGVLDDVAVPEEDPLGDLPPLGPLAEQELEVHREVLVLLAGASSDDARASGSCSTGRRCSYQLIASASSVSDANMRASVRVSRIAPPAARGTGRTPQRATVSRPRALQGTAGCCSRPLCGRVGPRFAAGRTDGPRPVRRLEAALPDRARAGPRRVERGAD